MRHAPGNCQEWQILLYVGISEILPALLLLFLYMAPGLQAVMAVAWKETSRIVRHSVLEISAVGLGWGRKPSTNSVCGSTHSFNTVSSIPLQSIATHFFEPVSQSRCISMPCDTHHMLLSVRHHMPV